MIRQFGLLFLIAVLAADCFLVDNLPTTTAWTVPLPPWRGTRQLLEIGPWGTILDVISQEENSPVVLYVHTNGSSELLPSSALPPKQQPRQEEEEEESVTTSPVVIVRIVATSDTHGKHRFVKIPDCDIFCHCGDILQRYGYLGDLGGGLPALIDFGRWLQKIPAKHAKVVIGGNHDRLLEKMGAARVQSLFDRCSSSARSGSRRRTTSKTRKSKGAGVYYLQDDMITIPLPSKNSNGDNTSTSITIYGSPWSPKGTTGNKAFQLDSDASVSAQYAKQRIALQNKKQQQQTKTNKTPGNNKTDRTEQPKIDILLTHATCSQWRNSLVRSNGVRFWAHGHWHDGQGRVQRYYSSSNNQNDKSSIYNNNNNNNVTQFSSPSCISVNVASNDMIYRPQNPPIVFDLDLSN